MEVVLDRCGIFVDARYLIAEGAKEFVSPAAKRGDVAVDYPALVRQLVKHANEACGLPLLRVYWYDGAVDRVPTNEQLAISALPDVKLRLGGLTKTGQKGVDALVYRDLTTLARERAIVTAFLLAGDEDLREGVAMAQELGVHVSLWGAGGVANQSRTLAAEVDRCERLDPYLTDLFAPAPGSRLALARQPAPMPGTPGPEPAAVQATAAEFARTWTARATFEEVGELLAGRPRVPASLDAELLRTVQARHGDLRDRDDLRHAARAAFWKAVEDHGRSMS
jgi:uncharacterized LabA/DUF88 family protein